MGSAAAVLKREASDERHDDGRDRRDCRGAYAGFNLILDPVVTPLRVTGAVLLATGLGVIWQLRQH